MRWMAKRSTTKHQLLRRRSAKKTPYIIVSLHIHSTSISTVVFSAHYYSWSSWEIDFKFFFFNSGKYTTTFYLFALFHACIWLSKDMKNKLQVSMTWSIKREHILIFIQFVAKLLTNCPLFIKCKSWNDF